MPDTLRASARMRALTSFAAWFGNALRAAEPGCFTCRGGRQAFGSPSPAQVSAAFGLMNHDRKRAMAIIIQPKAPRCVRMCQERSGSVPPCAVELVFVRSKMGDPGSHCATLPHRNISESLCCHRLLPASSAGVRSLPREREQRAQDVRQRIERHQGDLADLRSRILARQRSG